MQDLPETLYCVDSVVQLEQAAINRYDIPAYDLMKRAGAAVFNIIETGYSQNKKILVLCGAGNNAGDGYVVARLARQAGYAVRVISLVEPATLKNEASLAYQDWFQQFDNEQELSTVTGVATEDHKEFFSWLGDAEVIVDAILGTGIKRDVSVTWSAWITAVNESAKPVISVDIPSGLFADSGHIAGVAIQATVTVCFIGLKQGMFTARGNDVCGEIIFDNLALPEEVYQHVPAAARLIKAVDYALLAKRKASSHKGCFGHVLIVGGNHGMPGAVILAARAALRTGAGLVTIITIAQHLEAISSAVPEAMIKTCGINAEEGLSIDDLFNEPFIDHVTHVAIGMGLGQDAWSLRILQHCLRLNKPMLIDADALNLVAKHDFSASDFSKISPLVITPHPGEAARLLSKTEENTTADVQKDRFTAIKKLHQLFYPHESCTVILKGSGTLIFDGGTIRVCRLGNAAMAAPGMGDVLSGIVIALLAQNKIFADAANSDLAALAVCLHAAAAAQVTADKTRGLLASDVINELTEVLQ
jgi:NAD(P)H-hydrate epimerase